MAPRKASRVLKTTPNSPPIRPVPVKQDGALNLRVDEFGLMAPGGSEWADPMEPFASPRGSTTRGRGGSHGQR